MSKKNLLGCSTVGFIVNGYTEKKFNYLVGRVKTIVDSLGLSEKQTKALSDLLVGEIWNVWDNAQFVYSYEGNEEDPEAKMIN